MATNNNNNNNNNNDNGGKKPESEFSKGFWRTLGKVAAVAVVGGVGYGISVVFPPAAPLAVAATSAVANS